jgi:hypothetical protein
MRSPKKILVYILIIISSLILTGIGLSIYYWRQFTELPDWYQSQDKKTSAAAIALDPAQRQTNQLTLQQKLQAQVQQQLPQGSTPLPQSPPVASTSILGLPVILPKTQQSIALQLDDRDLQQLVLDNWVQKPQTQPLLGATKGLKTTIKGQTVAIAAVINSQEILQSPLNSPKKQQIKQFLANFPQFKDRDLAIQVEGKLHLEPGKLILDSQSTLKIGKVSFSIAEFSQRTGISPEKIRQTLAIDSGSPAIKSIQLKDNQLTLEIAPHQSMGDN